MPSRSARQGVCAGAARARGVVGELLAVGGVPAVPASLLPKLVVAIVRIITSQRKISAFIISDGTK